MHRPSGEIHWLQPDINLACSFKRITRLPLADKPGDLIKKAVLLASK
jgi:hypothetical protein